MNKVLVVPTVRPGSLDSFMSSWNWPARLGENDALCIVCDAREPFLVMEHNHPRVHVYSWQDIDAELGDESWVIPRKSDAVRSFGFLKALELGADMIATLDDDCYPDEQHNWLYEHYWRTGGEIGSPAWQSTLTGVLPRGMPYLNRMRTLAPAVNVGMWAGVPDLDAPTQMTMERFGLEWETLDGVAPIGMYIPMCGMNLAFRRNVSTIMYFLLMGQDEFGNMYPYDRFADIWCGVIAKKIMDYHKLGMSFGSPIVHHVKASNQWTNLEKEAPGLHINEYLWSFIDDIRLRNKDISSNYLEIAGEMARFGESNIVPDKDRAYWTKLGEAMEIWTQLVHERL